MTIAQSRYQEWKKNGFAQTMDETQVDDCFYQELQFGTGGLRGKIGDGTNRMNSRVIIRATLGLAKYVNAQSSTPSVVIAYDSRQYSKDFALLSAQVLSSQGIKAYLFNQLTPTPVLSYAVRQLSATAGIVITASHNPKQYNGYKVYNQHGCQITDSDAQSITECIAKYGYFEQFTPNDSLVTVLDEQLLQRFVNGLFNYSYASVTCQPKIVYTPLCGTGLVPAKMLFSKMGLADVHVVAEQENPDETFATCPFPNPEEDTALALAYRDAERLNAELILATDPDADRLGVAERLPDGTIKRFSGHEVGLVLLQFVISQSQAMGKDLRGKHVFKTIVTTDLAKKMAVSHGIACGDVLTGFKYIGEKIDQLASEKDFLFALEDSCGYLVGAFARDKDAIGALMLVCEAKSYYKSQSKTLWQVLDEIYQQYGYEATRLNTILFEGSQGAQKKQKIIDDIRNKPFTHVDGKAVTRFVDYKKGVDGLPPSDVLQFVGDDFMFVIRPSGTEPKLKMYYFANGKTYLDAQRWLEIIEKQVQQRLV